jgi:hypothetical protein
MGSRFDLRSRTVDDLREIEIVDFHTYEVPRLLETNGVLAATSLRNSGLESIVIAVGDDAYTWDIDDNGSLRVQPGDFGRARADLTDSWFSDLVGNIRSSVAVLVSGDPVMTRGNVMHLIAWETTLRALVDGWQGYEPGAISFVDRNGSPLDLTRSFRIDDDPLELMHFLSETGFLLLKGVFTPDEVALMNRAVDQLHTGATPADDKAWYATVAGVDEPQCVRVNDLPEVALEVSMVERLGGFVALCDAQHEFDHIDVLMKPVGVVEGISDLPWHKDCSLGLHSYQCLQIICGVSLTASGPENGQLGVVAGSHRVNLSQFGLSEEIDLPQIFVATEPGDVTVHTSCTLHCSTPPLHSQRRVAYSTFMMEGDTSSLEARIREVRDQAGRDTFAPNEE